MLINLLPLLLNNWRAILPYLAAVVVMVFCYYQGYQDGKDSVLDELQDAKQESQAKADEVAKEYEGSREVIQTKTETAKKVVYETRVSTDCRHGAKRLQSYHDLIKPTR